MEIAKMEKLKTENGAIEEMEKRGCGRDGGMV